MLPDIRISKESGLGRRTTSADMVIGLVLGGIATTEYATLGTTVELRGVSDAKVLGFDAAYDETNKVLVYHHVERIFARNKSAKVYLKVVAQTVTLAEMADVALTHVAGLLVDAKGEVGVVGIALNPASGYSETLTTGLNSDVIAAIPKAQALVESEFTKHRPVFVVIEGRHFNATAAAALDLRTKEAEGVAVVIAADYNVSQKEIGGTKPYQYYAAIGDTLGMISAAKVNENIGWVGKFPLTDTSLEMFTKAALSSGLAIETYEADYATLHDKGYIYAKPHEGKTGYYYNSSPTCAAIDHDEAYIENARSLNKGAKLIRSNTLDALNSPVLLNEDGTVQAVIIGALEGLAEEGLLQMQRDGEVSNFDVYIDPEIVFMENSESLDVEYSMQPVGVLRELKGKIKLVAKI
jgi:hypothetical protein